MKSMEGDEYDDALKTRFHGLQVILEGSQGFCCGTKSAGKRPGLVEEDEDMARLHWPIQTNFARFFLFPVYYVLFPYNIIHPV